MKHTVKELGDCQVELLVDVDKDVWASAQQREYKKALANVQIKGFRKGKAPEAMARAYVNQGRVMDEALNSVLNPVYAQALTEAKLNPFTRPSVEVTKVSDVELQLKFIVTLAPKVELGQYTGLKAERKAVSVTDKEVTESINKRLEQAAELEVVERAAKLGDTVVLDFKGFIDGKPFEGGEASNYELVLGSNSFVPGFEDALVGVKAEEDKVVDITFPEQYVKELAGKPASFQCHIHEIKEKKIPALSDEAVEDLALKDVHTVEELKEFEKKSILEGKTNEAHRAYYEAIVDQIVAASKVTIAPSILDQEAATQEEQTKKQITDNGLTFEQYLEITGQTEEGLRANLRQGAEANLKRYLVLQTVAAKEHMIVDDNELDIELSRLADQYKMKLEDVKKALGPQIDNFRENLQARKIQEFLLANNGGSEKKEAPAKKEAEKSAKKPAAKKKAAKSADKE